MKTGLLGMFGVMAITAACSSSGASFSGTIHGQSFSPQEAISGTVTATDGSGNTTGYLLIANRTGLCADAAGNKTPKSLAGFLILLNEYTGNADHTVSPSGAGTFVVSNGSSGKIAFAAFISNDDSCQEINAKSAAAASGTVTLTSASAGNYAGSYDLMLDSGDHVTGSFSSANCSAITTLGSSSTPTCF